MKQIKSTKSVYMAGDIGSILIRVQKNEDHNAYYNEIQIPNKLIWQVIRGLVSYSQKYYRKNITVKKVNLAETVTVK